MAAVRRGRCVEPSMIFGHSGVRPPTDVMAITSLPKATYHARHLPPGAATRHPKRCDASSVHPATDATPSRPSLMPFGQFPKLSIKGHVNNY